MSLQSKWEEYRKQYFTVPFDEIWELRLREAFYAGAEATLAEYRKKGYLETEIQAEIDHFRSHK